MSCEATEDKPAAVKQEGGSDSSSVTNDSATGDTDAATTDDVVVEEAQDEADPIVEEEAAEDEAPTVATLGDLMSVGDWDVKITEVALDANAVIHKANMFNDKPKGQYVLVSYEATYNGAERTADTGFDLTWSFTTTDSQVSEQAYEVTPADNHSWPSEARTGGTVKGQVLFDLDPNLTKGGLLTVEAYDSNFDTVYADFMVA